VEHESAPGRGRGESASERGTGATSLFHTDLDLKPYLIPKPSTRTGQSNVIAFHTDTGSFKTMQVPLNEVG